MAADGHWYRRSRWRDLIRIALRPDLPRGVSSCALHLAIAASNTCGGMGLRLWRPGAGLRARKPGAAPTRFGVLASRCSFRKLIRHTCQSMQLGHTHTALHPCRHAHAIRCSAACAGRPMRLMTVTRAHRFDCTRSGGAHHGTWEGAFPSDRPYPHMSHMTHACLMLLYSHLSSCTCGSRIARVMVGHRWLRGSGAPLAGVGPQRAHSPTNNMFVVG